jgi:hypothetical protein
MGSLYRRLRWRVRKRKGRIAAAAVLALTGIVVYVLWPAPNLRVGSVSVGDGSVRVAVRTPRSYRIVYRSELRTAGELTVTTERVWTRRPFESRLETWSGPPPGRKRLSVTVDALGRLNTGRAVFAVPPGPAATDRRPDVFLHDALRAGYAQARERRRVARRVCRVYRIGGDPGTDSLKPMRRVRRDYTDVCIDEAGLVLEEVGIVRGELTSRSIAVDIDEHPRLRKGLFRIGKPSIPAIQGGGSVRSVDPHSRSPGTFWEAPSAPAGLKHKGRYAVVPPQTGFNDPTARGRIVAWVSDVWARGPDVLVVEQGGTLEGADPFAADRNASRVRVGALGRGELAYSLRSSEVRVKLRGGHFVRVIGTLAPSRLLAFARSLEKRKGGALVYLDKGP